MLKQSPFYRTEDTFTKIYDDQSGWNLSPVNSNDFDFFGNNMSDLTQWEPKSISPTDFDFFRNQKNSFYRKEEDFSKIYDDQSGGELKPLSSTEFDSFGNNMSDLICVPKVPLPASPA